MQFDISKKKKIYFKFFIQKNIHIFIFLNNVDFEIMNNRIENLGTGRRIEKLARVLQKRTKDLTVVAENIADPHNLSAMLRSCDAVGIMKIHLVYSGKQKFPTLGENSSASARKWVESEKHTDIANCYASLRAEGFKIYTTHLSKEAISLYDLDLTQKVALVFGNEHEGVSEEAVDLADGNFIIPQIGMIQSLNISVACAVSVYEAFRQRNNAGLYDNPEFSAEEYNQQLEKWLLK